jgi:predicted HNH restriction endonuclease
MKKGYCKKCGKYGWVHSHHVLPKHTFESKVTYRLCPNCHTDYHETNKRSFYKWLIGVIIVIILIAKQLI